MSYTWALLWDYFSDCFIGTSMLTLTCADNSSYGVSSLLHWGSVLRVYGVWGQSLRFLSLGPEGPYGKYKNSTEIVGVFICDYIQPYRATLIFSLVLSRESGNMRCELVLGFKVSGRDPVQLSAPK